LALESEVQKLSERLKELQVTKDKDPQFDEPEEYEYKEEIEHIVNPIFPASSAKPKGRGRGRGRGRGTARGKGDGDGRGKGRGRGRGRGKQQRSRSR
jgi:hypothetical protein